VSECLRFCRQCFSRLRFLGTFAKLRKATISWVMSVRFLNVQRDATICSWYFILLHDHSTCFGCVSHPSSGIHKTVVTATGTTHWSCSCTINDYVLTEFTYYAYHTRRDIWLVPMAVTELLCTLDDGCERHPKHVEWSCSKIKYKLHIVAARWTLII